MKWRELDSYTPSSDDKFQAYEELLSLGWHFKLYSYEQYKGWWYLPSSEFDGRISTPPPRPVGDPQNIYNGAWNAIKNYLSI